MICSTRIRETNQIFAHIENKAAETEKSMTFKPGISGNPAGNRYHTRHLLNQEFIQALLLHFREHGKKAIEKVAREQPASYVKILALLVPREHKVEYSNSLKTMTDEQLDAAIEMVKQMLEERAGEGAKVIEGAAEAVALPAPKRPNRLMMEADTAVGPRERRPRQRKVPSPSDV